MFFLEIQFAIPLLTGLFSFFLGVFVFLSNQRSATNRYFFAVSIAITMWAIFVAIFHLPIVNAIKFWNLHWLAGIFIMPVYLLLFLNFPSAKSTVSPSVKSAVWLGTFILGFVFALWPQNFFEYFPGESGAVPVLSAGPFSWLLEAYFLVYAAAGIFFFAKTFLKNYGRERAQILTGLIGLSVGVTGAFITNIFLSVHFERELIWLGPIFIVVATTSVSYTILGIRGERPRLLPIGILWGFVILALGVQMLTSTSVESFIFSSTLLAGTSLLAIFLIRDILLETADLRRFQALLDKLKKTNEELKQSDQIKSEFISLVSHHLRTPLTHIKWSLEELMQGAYGKFSSEPQRKVVADLLLSNERLVGFIDSLLDSSRIEAGELILKKEVVDLMKLLAEVVDQFSDEAKNYYRVDIILIPPTITIPQFLVDRSSMRRIFENVIENAMIYNHTGGKVYIKVDTSGSFFEVEISDTGIGISREDLLRVGEKFYRSAAAKRIAAENTGLGIYIAENIIKLHGGTLTIQSEEGTGTSVSLKFPATLGEPKHVPRAKNRIPEMIADASTMKGKSNP